MSATVKLKLLGAFEITEPPTTTSTRLYAKEKAVIAYVALHAGRAVARETIRKLLWSDSPDDKGRHSVSQTLYKITKALPNWLELSQSTVTFTLARNLVDAHLALELAAAGRFADLEGLMNGDLIADVVSGSEEFDEWRDNTNALLQKDMEMRIAQSILALATHAPARAYADCVKIASRMPDSAPLKELADELFETTAHTIRVPSTRHGQDKDAFSIPFLGRSSEMGQLGSSWAEVLNGHGKVVLVSATAGQGKTRLLNEFVSQVQHSAQIARIRCYEPEMNIGLNTAIDIVQESLNSSHGEAQTAQILGVRDAESTAPSATASTSSSSLASPGEQRQVFEAMSGAIISARRSTPLIIVVDDFQWADRSSIAFVHFFSRRISAERIMLVAAGRPSSRTRAFSQAKGITTLSLRELQEADLGDLSRSMSFANTVSSGQLMRLTGGNPFLLTECIRSMGNKSDRIQPHHSITTGNLDGFVRGLVADLPTGARHVMRCLAVIGRPIDAVTLEKITHLKPISLAKALGQLRQKRVALGTREVSFRHDIIREAVYRRMSVVRRRAIHLKVATILKEGGGNDDEVARHFYRGADTRNAHVHALAAASRADQRTAISEVTYFLRMAIKTSQDKQTREELRYNLAVHLFRTGNYASAIEVAGAIVKQKSAGDRVKSAAIVLLQLDALVKLRRISSSELLEVLSKFEHDYTTILSDGLRHEMLRITVMAHSFEANAIEVDRLTLPLADLARRLPDDSAAFALSEAARAASWASSWTKALPMAVESESLLVFKNLEAVARTWLNIADINYEAGQYQVALTLYDKCFDFINKSGALHIWPRAATNKVALLVDMGRFEEARRLAEETITNWTEGDQEQTLSSTYSNLALMQYALGDYEAARKFAELSLSHGFDLPFHRMTVKSIVGIIALEVGKLREASQIAIEVNSDLESTRGRYGDFSYIEIFLARWRFRSGQSDEALRLLQAAIDDGEKRDFGGWLRMRLELARQIRRTNGRQARQIAEEVRLRAAQANAAPLEEAAANLILRI